MDPSRAKSDPCDPALVNKNDPEVRAALLLETNDSTPYLNLVPVENRSAVKAYIDGILAEKIAAEKNVAILQKARISYEKRITHLETKHVYEKKIQKDTYEAEKEKILDRFQAIDAATFYRSLIELLEILYYPDQLTREMMTRRERWDNVLKDQNNPNYEPLFKAIKAHRGSMRTFPNDIRNLYDDASNVIHEYYEMHPKPIVGNHRSFATNRFYFGASHSSRVANIIEECASLRTCSTQSSPSPSFLKSFSRQSRGMSQSISGSRRSRTSSSSQTSGSAGRTGSLSSVSGDSTSSSHSSSASSKSKPAVFPETIQSTEQFLPAGNPDGSVSALLGPKPGDSTTGIEELSSSHDEKLTHKDSEQPNGSETSMSKISQEDENSSSRRPICSPEKQQGPLKVAASEIGENLESTAAKAPSVAAPEPATSSTSFPEKQKTDEADSKSVSETSARKSSRRHRKTKWGKRKAPKRSNRKSPEVVAHKRKKKSSSNQSSPQFQ